MGSNAQSQNIFKTSIIFKGLIVFLFIYSIVGNTLVMMHLMLRIIMKIWFMNLSNSLIFFVHSCIFDSIENRDVHEPGTGKPFQSRPPISVLIPNKYRYRGENSIGAGLRFGKVGTGWKYNLRSRRYLVLFTSYYVPRLRRDYPSCLGRVTPQIIERHVLTSCLMLGWSNMKRKRKS